MSRPDVRAATRPCHHRTLHAPQGQIPGYAGNQADQRHGPTRIRPRSNAMNVQDISTPSEALAQYGQRPVERHSMSLAERVTQRPETINGYPCSVGSLIASIEGDELAALQKIMYGRAGLTEPRTGYKGWTEREVFDTVTGEGYSVAKNQINEHRGKRCRCYRDAR